MTVSRRWVAVAWMLTAVVAATACDGPFSLNPRPEDPSSNGSDDSNGEEPQPSGGTPESPGNASKDPAEDVSGRGTNGPDGGSPEAGGPVGAEGGLGASDAADAQAADAGDALPTADEAGD